MAKKGSESLQDFSLRVDMSRKEPKWERRSQILKRIKICL